MDVDLSSSDNDSLASELLQKFSCLNTNDRDVLVKQFKLLLGEKCIDSTAEFWLDMNNWNLQAAICSYFDNESTSNSLMLQLPSVQITIPEQNMNEYLPNSSFTYSCLIYNSGDDTWPQGCSLRFCGGQEMCKEERWLLPQLIPKQSYTLNLQLTSPDKAGLYCSQWRFSTITGQFFGETIFIIVNVLDDLNQVTTQLSAAHIVDHMQQQHQVNEQMPQPLHSTPMFSINDTSFMSSANPNNNPNIQQPISTMMPICNGHDSSNVMSSNNLIDNPEHHHQQQQQQQNKSHQINNANHLEDSAGSSSYPDDDSSMTI